MVTLFFVKKFLRPLKIGTPKNRVPPKNQKLLIQNAKFFVFLDLQYEEHGGDLIFCLNLKKETKNFSYLWFLNFLLKKTASQFL